MTRAWLTALVLSFCVPHDEGKIVLITFTDSGFVMQRPYRDYMTDLQNKWVWEKMIRGPVQVRIAPASESLPTC